MSRTARDRDAETAAILAAINRLLEGTPLRSESGKLTATELITESGLRRDVVYEHPELLDLFKARVKAQHSTPAAMQELVDKLAATGAELTRVRGELARERGGSTLLRMAVAELSLELDEARAQLADIAGVTRLPAARNAAGSLAADTRNSYPAS
jgi:hypothetical protein